MKISKKKILLGIPIILISLELYFGVLFGYFLGKILSGKQVGQKGKLALFNVFNIGKWKLHIHHWFYGLVILVSIFFFDLPLPQFSFGFFGGLIFQGIFCYPDWYKILIKQK